MKWFDKLYANTLGRSKQKTLTQLIDKRVAIQQAIDVIGNHVVCLDLRQNNLYDLYGSSIFGNNVPIEQCYTYIHPDDQDIFRQFIARLSKGLVKEDECRYRWDFNYTGAGVPDWHEMHCYAIAEFDEDGKVPINIIATLTDEEPMRQKQREIEALSERYHLIFEDSIIGLSFYSPEGWLLAANRMMRQICNFDSDTSDEFFSNANLFDQAPFSELIDRNNVQEFWCCSLSVVPERNMHVYLEIRLRPILNADGKLAYISVAVRDINEERELYHQAKQNEVDLQRVSKSIKLYEAELRYMLQSCNMRVWRASLADRKVRIYHGLSTIEREISFDELLGGWADDSENLQLFKDSPEDFYAKTTTYMVHSHSIFHDTDTMQWDRINSIPVYDDDGKLTGAFGLIRNMTDIMQKQEQLKQETERANEAGHQKSVFLANMTHEIRTPLNAIVGFADVLPLLSNEAEKQEMVRVIMNNCDMLLRLVNDMLEASDMNQSLVIEKEKTELVEFFNDLYMTLKPRVNNPDIEFLKDNPYAIFGTNIDKGRLLQIFTNFVTNAVKYTKQGHIRIGWREEHRVLSKGATPTQGLYFYCEDTGLGIAKEQQSSIFERFVKLNDFVQGSGLGLSNCRSIVEKWGGQIGVTSEGQGKGSTFWFWIPA